MKSPQTRFAMLVEEFFLDRLIRQRNASPQTVAAYRDCFRLLVEFARDHRSRPVEQLTLEDLDAPCILAFLDYREKDPAGNNRASPGRVL